jgi:hypothetical protein
MEPTYPWSTIMVPSRSRRIPGRGCERGPVSDPPMRSSAAVAFLSSAHLIWLGPLHCCMHKSTQRTLVIRRLPRWSATGLLHGSQNPAVAEDHHSQREVDRHPAPGAGCGRAGCDHRLLAAGCWLLAAGCWLLAAGPGRGREAGRAADRDRDRRQVAARGGGRAGEAVRRDAA